MRKIFRNKDLAVVIPEMVLRHVPGFEAIRLSMS